MITAVIHGNNLRQDDKDGVILASATEVIKPHWHWSSHVAMKAGKRAFQTVEQALLDAAEKLHVTVVQVAKDPVMWTIDPVDFEDGRPRIYVVSTVSNGDDIRFTLEYEREARELRDMLNRIGTAVTSFAI